ncbi:MAG: 2-amino-4-hydroxy-6-hydroxymethyldihydropteridine diphosphokinase, partial [Neisseria elongata]
MTTPVTAVIAFGSNLGESTDTIRLAAERLSRHPGIASLRLSPLYRTAPVGYTDQPDFVNAAALIETTLDAYALLSLLHTVEQDAGRERSFRNAPLIDEQRRHRSLVDASGAAQVLHRQVAAARATVCVSDPVADWVRRRTADLPDANDVVGRIHTVPNGVSVRRIQPQPEDPDRVVVTFVGTLKPWHGVADLITAAALARQSWSLRIIGDGPEMDSLRAQAGRLGVEVDFRGAVAPQDIPTHVAGSAIGVAPYPDLGGGEQQYFSPMKVLEYLAAGLAVVASDVGQVPQLLEDGSGRHGVLVAPSDPTALAAALDDLAVCPDRRARMVGLGLVGRDFASRGETVAIRDPQWVPEWMAVKAAAYHKEAERRERRRQRDRERRAR